MHLSTFIGNVSFTIGALLVLGFCGWFAVAPFRRDLRFVMLAAPLAGILVLTMGALAGYVFLRLPMRQAGILSLSATMGLSLLAVEWRRPSIAMRDVLFLLPLSLILILSVVRLMMAASLDFGGAGLLFFDGTDHLGYAHLADWLNNHSILASPVADPSRPYESWPTLLFQADPRFGSHTFLALIAQASGHSAMFSYDLCTTVILVATILAVAGVFARSPLTICLLVVGLLASHWFDYAKCGFLGKVLDYPSAFILAGLYFSAAGRTVAAEKLVALAVLAAGGALMHSGLVLAMFVGLLGAGFIVGMLCLVELPAKNLDYTALRGRVLTLTLIVGVALLSSGTLARPLPSGFPDWSLEWRYILPRAADLENQGSIISGYSSGVLQGLSWAMLAIGLVGGLVATIFRVPAAVSLLLGPLVLLAVLYRLNSGAAVFQMIGMFYPLGLCGLAVLWDELPGKIFATTASRHTRLLARYTILILALIAIGLHMPRFIGAARRYAGSNRVRLVLFSERQMQDLAKAIGSDTVDVDIPDSPQLNIVVLVELGRQGINLQWQPASWSKILSYRPWAPPKYEHPGTLRLVSITAPTSKTEQVVFRTDQFVLLRPARVAVGRPR